MQQPGYSPNVFTAFALWVALTSAGPIMSPILAIRLTLFPPQERELEKPRLDAIIMVAILGVVAFH